MIRRLLGRRRPNPETAGWQLTRERLVWLTASLALVLAPHALRVPIWITLAFCTFALWRLGAASGRIAPPSRWVVIVTSLAMLPAVNAHYGNLLGRDSGIALLVVLAAMKLTETRTLRDAHIACTLGYFLVITNFLYSQTIPTGLYMVACIVVITATCLSLAGDGEGAWARLRTAGGLLAQAAPLMVVLFVLFPRLPGPLWGLPKDAFGARTGLSNTMSPGAIGQLSESDAVAFRVRFDGDGPNLRDMYWRGPVLWNTDGRTWRAGSIRTRGAQPELAVDGAPVDYEITLEAHQDRWLFALDVPVTVPEGGRITGDLQLRAVRPVRERRQYRMRSFTEYRLGGLSSFDVRRGLRLPENHHPRARSLAERWRAEGHRGRALVDAALEHFRSEPFRYTLSPARLTDDTVDEFLFETREGFCEFYAAAFTVLMRAAGLPARVVTGYQGGEFNPLGGYLIVRQRDAHAWAEVWLGEAGWVRVDPTAAVAPERVERGIDVALPRPRTATALGLGAAEPVERFFRLMRFRIDAVTSAWNSWVLGYGSSRQRLFLERFGIDARRLGDVVMLLVGALAALLLGIAAWLGWRGRRRPDPVSRAYERFCAKLARAGFTRRPSEGPVDFARRVGAARPSLAEPVAAITGDYVALRYRPNGGDRRAFARRIRRFRPV